MELKLTFDGRSAILIVLTLACVYGIYLGTSLALAARDLQSETTLMKQRIETLKSGNRDQLSMTETLEVAALGMQLQMNPNLLKDVEIEADKSLVRGLGILMVSLLAAIGLFFFYRKDQSRRAANANA